MSDLPLTPAQLAFEQTGLEFLRIGKFRKARDAFKLLHKTHPARALPLLIDANLGLAREMMAKGQVSEANQVLAYLKTIAPADLDLTAAVATAKVASGPRDAWSSMVPLAVMRLTASDTKPSALIRCADEIILGATSPDHPGHPDAHTILTALELGYASEHTAETSRLLRSVPRSSPFSHWVLFFKGMTALEAGDRSRAADCFGRVPENSLLQPAIATLLTVSGAPSSPQPTSRTVHGLCSWAGLSAIAEPLESADRLWRKEQYAKAFTLLVKKVPGLFCFGARSFYSDLTRLIGWKFAECAGSFNEFSSTVLEYAAGSGRRVASATMDQGFFSIKFADCVGCAHKHFSHAVTNLEAIHQCFPLSAAMRSQVFTQVAIGYLSALKENFNHSCSPPAAKKALELALVHDPGNFQASLKLCDLLATGKDTSAYHRFLDALAKRYPTHKEVLIRTGDSCTERKVYTKALRNFENAAKTDLLDPRITHGLLRARLGIAEEAYKKGTPAKANWDFIDALASPEQPLWRLRARRIVMEISHRRESGEISALIAAALPLAPSAFQLENACQFAGLKYLSQIRTLFSSYPEPETLADFLALLDEGTAHEGGKEYHSARALMREIFTQYQPLVASLVTSHKELIALLIRVFSASQPDPFLVSSVIEREYRRDLRDPVLGFIYQSYSHFWQRGADRSPFIDYSAELLELTDPDTRRLVQLLRKDDMRGFRRPDRKPTKVDLDYNPHLGDDEDDDWDDDDDDDDEDEDFSDLNEVEMLKKLEELSRALGIPIKRPPSKPSRS